MKDFATQTSGRGIDEQRESDESAGSVDSCCRSWLHGLRPTEPVEYKNEILEFLKTVRTHGQVFTEN